MAAGRDGRLAPFRLFFALALTMQRVALCGQRISCIMYREWTRMLEFICNTRYFQDTICISSRVAARLLRLVLQTRQADGQKKVGWLAIVEPAAAAAVLDSSPSHREKRSERGSVRSGERGA